MSGSENEITLNGSAEIICKYMGKYLNNIESNSFFFLGHNTSFPRIICVLSEIAIHAILFQRGVHSAKAFQLCEYYDLDIFMLKKGRKAAFIRSFIYFIKGELLAT